MLEKDYSETDCRKFLGGNRYRMMKQACVQQVSRILGERYTSMRCTVSLATGISVLIEGNKIAKIAQSIDTPSDSLFVDANH